MDTDNKIRRQIYWMDTVTNYNCSILICDKIIVHNKLYKQVICGYINIPDKHIANFIQLDSEKEYYIKIYRDRSIIDPDVICMGIMFKLDNESDDTNINIVVQEMNILIDKLYEIDSDNRKTRYDYLFVDKELPLLL